jgi:hypothetical protein
MSEVVEKSWHEHSGIVVASANGFDVIEYEKCGFEVLHHESTFPIDLFLLMGDNYIKDDTLGRQCHKKRKQFDMNLFESGQDGLRKDLYSAFAKIGIGSEIVMYARKIAI